MLTDHPEGLPSAYKVVKGHERFPRWYPMRFGKFRLDSRGYRISFGREEDAIAFCWNEQRDYVRAYPSAADKPIAPAFRDTAPFTEEDAREMREFIKRHEGQR